MYNMSVTISYGPVPTTNSGSGQFTISKNGVNVEYTYSGLTYGGYDCSDCSGFAYVSFSVSAPVIASYEIYAEYKNSLVNTRITPFVSTLTPGASISTFSSTATFASTPDASLASFTSGSTTGVLNQPTTTSNSLEAENFILQQQASGTSTTLTSGTDYSSTDWIKYGGPILCQAYVASLVNNDNTFTNFSTLVNAISIAVAGIYY
jgi:hypothetical protein